jgi:molecular chaperone DnaK
MATGNKQKIVIQSPTNLTQEEINQMVKEAAIYAEEDAKRRTEAQTRNKANIELDTGERMLREMGNQMSFDHQRRLRDGIERLRASLQTYDTDKIKEDTKILTDALYAVGTEAYLTTGGERAADAARKAGVDIEGMGGGAESSEEPSEEDLFSWFKK